MNKRQRIKKARKEPTGERRPRNPSRIAVGWGRGASEWRPGILTKRYLEQHGEGCAADIFYALREELERINEERIEIGEKPIRGCTYNSYARYFHWFTLLGLVEPTDRREPAIYDFLQERHFFRLTDKGKVEEEGWSDPARAAHPELR